jgi:hypothetical protein
VDNVVPLAIRQADSEWDKGFTIAALSDDFEHIRIIPTAFRERELNQAKDTIDWSSKGPNALSPECLTRVRQVLEEKGSVIVEHRFYYGSSAPDRLIFDDFDVFLEHVMTRSRPGDSFWIWDYQSVCRDDNPLATGKFPDAEGRVPSGGAY